MLESVTMLTGSRFIQLTAEFVRRFASLEASMRICTDPAIFDYALREAAAQ
jgi:phage regulator Rha-like protein